MLCLVCSAHASHINWSNSGQRCLFRGGRKLPQHCKACPRSLPAQLFGLPTCLLRAPPVLLGSPPVLLGLSAQLFGLPEMLLCLEAQLLRSLRLRSQLGILPAAVVPGPSPFLLQAQVLLAPHPFLWGRPRSLQVSRLLILGPVRRARRQR